MIKYVFCAMAVLGTAFLALAETSLTVYNQNLALVREVRKLDFKSGTGEQALTEVH